MSFFMLFSSRDRNYVGEECIMLRMSVSILKITNRPSYHELIKPVRLPDSQANITNCGVSYSIFMFNFSLVF